MVRSANHYTTGADLNARPVISNLPATVNVTELQTQPGFTLITLTFSDPDNTGAVKLEPECSVDPSSESFKFHYETNTRRLTLSSTIPSETLLDYEKTKHYLITCSVFDGYLYSEGDVLTVNVLNVNEPPVFDASTYFCTMYESKVGNNSERFRYNRASNKLTFNVDYDVDNSNMPTNVIVTIYALPYHYHHHNHHLHNYNHYNHTNDINNDPTAG
nr:hypothetical protein BaRGS_030645 [Batillaria attramentaria]